MFAALITRGENVKHILASEARCIGLNGKWWVSQQRQSYFRWRLETRATCTNRLGFRSAKCHTHGESGDSCIVSSVARNLSRHFRLPRRHFFFTEEDFSQNLVAPPFRLKETPSTPSFLGRQDVSGSSSSDKAYNLRCTRREVCLASVSAFTLVLRLFPKNAEPWQCSCAQHYFFLLGLPSKLYTAS